MKKKTNTLDERVSKRIKIYMQVNSRDINIYIKDIAESFIRWHNRNINIRNETAADALKELEAMRYEAAKTYMILHPEYACDRELMQKVEHACDSCVFQIYRIYTNS